MFFLLFSLPLLVQAIPGSYYECKQSTYDCSCEPTNQQTPYTDQKECDRECCPFWKCDSSAGKCALDLAGGYSRSSCAESCGGVDKNGYECLHQEFRSQCVPTLYSYQSKQSCETRCGTNNVQLCVYKCGTSYYQRCKTILARESSNCWNVQGSPPVPSKMELAGANCASNGDPCWPGKPCCGSLSCDADNQYCTNGQPPPTPPTLMCPGTSTPAEFVTVITTPGLEQCMQYDCDWNAGPKKPCTGLSGCPDESGTPACPTPALFEDHPSSNPKEQPPMFTVRKIYRPKSMAYMGISALLPPQTRAQKGSHVNHTVKWSSENGKHIFHLEYRAQLTENSEVIAIDDESDIEAITCSRSDQLMHLFLSQNHTKYRDQLFEKLKKLSFITAGPQWRCIFDDYSSKSPKTAALRKIVDLVFVSDDVVVVKTAAAHYTDLLRTANVTLRTNAFPKPIDVHPRSEHQFFREVYNQYARHTKQGHMHQEARVGGFFSWLGHMAQAVWSGIKKIAGVVENIVNAVTAAVKAIVTGDVDWDHTTEMAEINWNFDKNTTGAKEKNIDLGDGVACYECYSHLEVDLVFDFHMAEYSVSHVGAYLEGNLVHHVQMDVQQQSQVANLTLDKVLKILHFPDISFSLGPIPIVVQTTVPIHAGFELELAEAGSITAFSHVTGTAKYGMQWTSDKHFQFIHEHALSHSGNIDVDGKVSVGMMVYVMPVVWINVDHLGGPNIGFKGFVEPGVNFQTSGSQCSTGGQGAGAEYFVNFGLQLTVGAHIDIEFLGKSYLKKTWDPSPIWSHKWPLVSGCITNTEGNERHLQVRDSMGAYHMFDGVTYNGAIQVKAEPQCDQFHSVHVSAQLFTAEDGSTLFTVGPNDNYVRESEVYSTQYNVGCIGQQMYKLSFGQLAPYRPPPGSVLVQYLNCTLNAISEGYTYSSIGGVTKFSPDLGAITIDTKSDCFEPIQLQREQNTTHDPTRHDIVWPIVSTRKLLTNY